jgi:hypothetical protein
LLGAANPPILGDAADASILLGAALQRHGLNHKTMPALEVAEKLKLPNGKGRARVLLVPLSR